MGTVYMIGIGIASELEADLTANRTYAIPIRVGRKMQFPVRITLPLAEGVTDRLDALVEPDETRLDIIRSAIDKEVKRRERQRKDKPE